MQKNILKTFAIATATLMLMVASDALARQIGVIGLYEATKPANISIDMKETGALGCQLRRAGMIIDEQGDIGIDQPNIFVFLACDDSILADTAKRHALNGLVSMGKAVAVLEGALVDMPSPSDNKEISNRQYVLKVSHYNNLDTDARERDLDLLTKEAELRPDAYAAESFIAVNRALGMQTPDEVVVLFYDTPEQGDRFRKNNPDVMGKVDNFNKSHLDEHIYYVGKAAR